MMAFSVVNIENLHRPAHTIEFVSMQKSYCWALKLFIFPSEHFPSKSDVNHNSSKKICNLSRLEYKELYWIDACSIAQISEN